MVATVGWEPWRRADDPQALIQPERSAEYLGRNDERAGGTMRVYHLLPRKWALCDLKHDRLKVATFDDLNDPFELRGVRLENRDDRHRFNCWRNLTATKVGLLCFSKSWRNPVLWSHYADEHKGICLGFDVPESCLSEVKYVPERLQFEQLVPDEDQLQRLLRTKFKDWGIRSGVPAYSPPPEDLRGRQSSLLAIRWRSQTPGSGARRTLQGTEETS